MKKRFKLKKKILGISLAALLVGFPLTTNRVENVKADDCVDHTNYYLFNNAYYISSSNRPTSPPSARSTFSTFSTELPANAKIDSNSDVTYTWLNVANGEDGWTYSKFASEYQSWNGRNVKKSGNTWIYFHDKWYGDDNNNQLSDNSVSEDMTANNMIYVPASDHSLYAPNLYNAKISSEEFINIGIVRTYNSSWVSWVSDKSGYHYEPAVLRAKFKVCSGTTPDPDPDEPTPGDNVELTIHYYLEGTTTKLTRDNTKELEPNSDYNENCKSISGYTNVNSSVSGTIGTSNKEEICYYKQASTPTETVKLTINYLDKSGNVLKTIGPKTFDKGTTTNASCPSNTKVDGVTYIFDNYTLDGSSKSTDLSKLVMDKDTVVNCIYTKEAAATADLPIFIVWAVGGGALAYSIYFFRKYYKEQNEV